MKKKLSVFFGSMTMSFRIPFLFVSVFRQGYSEEVSMHSGHQSHGYHGKPYTNQYGGSYGETRRSARRRILPATPTGTINIHFYFVSLCIFLPFHSILPLSIAVLRMVRQILHDIHQHIFSTDSQFLLCSKNDLKLIHIYTQWPLFSIYVHFLDKHVVFNPTANLYTRFFFAYIA